MHLKKNSETTGDQEDFIKNKIRLTLELHINPSMQLCCQSRKPGAAPAQFLDSLFPKKAKKVASGAELTYITNSQGWNVRHGCSLLYIKSLLIFSPVRD